MTDMSSAPLEAELPPPPSTADEGEICRVCRAEGDEEMPLIYPCKCAGSVRYVHADCLKQWLASRGGQRVCEICHHNYAFTKVYADFLPRTIPFEVVLRQVVRIVCQILYRISRVYLACNAWLLILPMANMYTMISMLWAVDIASPSPRPQVAHVNETLTGNSTMPDATASNETRIAIHEIFGHPLRTMNTIVQDSWVRWNAGEANTLFGFIFRGQILSIGLTSLVMGIILIREWMSQHDWEAHAARERDREPIDPDKWVVRNGVAYKKADPREGVLEWRDRVPLKPTGSIETAATLGEDDGNEDDWEDEETIDGEPDSVTFAPDPRTVPENGPPVLVEPERQESPSAPGPSTPPARPCNADKEGFEKEVSYAAPELIGDSSRQDKGKGVARDDLDPPAQTEASPAQPDIAATPAGGLTVPAIPDPSRSTSPLSQPTHSDGHTDGDDDVPPFDIAAVIEAMGPPPPLPPAVEVIVDAEEAAQEDHPEDDDFEDAQLDMEDWDGVLEIIGLIGPVQHLVQNALFGYMIMGGSLFVLVGGPMWIGRIFLSVDYVRASIHFVKLVNKGSEVVFGPLLRVAHDIGKEVIVLPLLSSYVALEKIVAKATGFDDAAASVERINQIIPVTVRERASAKAGDVFESIGQVARSQAVSLYHAERIWANNLLASKTLTSRLTSVAVGYTVIGSCMCLLAFNPSGSQGSAAAAIVDSVRRNSQFIKLAFFMFIELAVFPIMIGFVIAFSTIPMLADWDLSDVTSYAYEIPAGAVIIAWIVGTSFMFWFAAVLQKIRKLFRKGVLFFIRDPAERSYNPVQEILERPASSQIRKLGISAVMYTVVIAHLLGGWCWTLGRGPLRNFGILPLRTSKYDAITPVPLDQLFVFVMCSPDIVNRFPWSTLRRRAERWWRQMIHLYNLASLLRYAETVPPESVTATRVWRCLDIVDQIVLGRYYNSSCRARVPAADGIALLRPEERRGRGVFVRLDDRGRPTNEDDKMRLLQQDAAAREKKRDPKLDYTVVWLPQFWRTRVHALILTALVTTGSVACFILVGPILAGRLALDRILSAPAHDGYNWIVGAGLMWCLSLLGNRAKRFIVASQRAERIRASSAATRVKRTAVASLRPALSAGVLFLLMPTLVGVVWELYIAMPLRYGHDPATPVLHLWEAWAMGMALTLAYVALHQETDARLRMRARRRTDDWHFRLLYRELHLDDLDTIWSETWRPMLCLLGMIVTPAVLALALVHSAKNDRDKGFDSVMYRWLHPLCLAVFVVIIRRRNIGQRYQAFRQDLIDAEYVVEERIENFDADATQTADASVQGDELMGVLDLDEHNEWAETEGDEDGSEWEDVDEA